MLKQLELIGFKSFAERTVFAFGSGITAIVGPNGSGKSNVVDAVRWIMGEQSAKSLRGGGMTDVIFNGSATRKSLGLAEVSLTFDNSRRSLAIDADEVQITRRVYRDGTGEYLINRQMSRLRDIKEMFLGSGAGVDAYCIIAQGRVEALLQASSQERRFILEEAAGISRFRVKKLETLRKLEQVEQNLQRIRDIQDELQRQLQSVRHQAAKAERYREYTEGLKHLRVALALQEWHSDTQKLHGADQALTTLKQTLEERSSLATAQEQALAELDTRLSHQEDASRRTETALSELREKMATQEGVIRHETATLADLGAALTQLALRQSQLGAQEQRLAQVLSTLLSESERQEKDRDARWQQLTDAEQALSSTSRQLAAVRQQLQHGKEALYEKLQSAARLHNDLISLRTQAESLRQHRRRLGEKHAQAQGTLSALDVELKTLEATEEDANERMKALREGLSELRERKELTALNLETSTGIWTAQREKRSGLASRIQLLDALEQSREGLGTGVRRVLELSGQADPGPWSTVMGLLADLILVDREHAALVDSALGDQVQAIVVRDGEQLQSAVKALGDDLPGRVSFLPLAAMASSNSGRLALPGLEPLSKYVGSTHAELSAMADHLLADTWITENLPQALQWSQHYPDQRFITQDGEMVDQRGFMALGPDHTEHGFVSRKSELRDLREQVIELDAAIAVQERELESLRAALAQLTSQEEQAEQGLQVLAEEAAGLRSRLQQQRLHGQDLVEEVRLGQDEIHTLDQELARLTSEESAAQEKAQSAEASAQHLQVTLQQAEIESAGLEAQRQKEQEALVSAKVAMATVEQATAALHERLETARQNQAEKKTEVDELARQCDENTQRQQNSQRSLSEAQTLLEQGKSDRAALEGQLSAALAQIQTIRQEAAQLREQSQHIRQEWQQIVDQVHAREMEASELRLRMESLAARLVEEHEVQLHEAYLHYQPPEVALEPAATLEQINELRRKIARLGNVSLDSLQELASLESRAQGLQTQQDDLTEAKKSLDEIIERINSDSRKMFQETYESVRLHFQELFRKLFGGGMADIVLENPDDLLETGVDIVARPPGKEMRNMSLLSGGEKTLTAVALLLAIFKNKPSPFCIMDEVDAALDEANVGRFASVLREFLHLSQFILITHSKSTMATVDVLYGVTMQEAGVSKRVAVRLDDYEEPAPRLAA